MNILFNFNYYLFLHIQLKTRGMHFEKDKLYHVYNRSINNNRIFYKRDNYLYFLQKVRNHLTNYCSIIAYCLMPNHFHLLLYINNTELLVKNDNGDLIIRSINQSFGIMLRSYTNAIHNQENMNGSLFQQHSKAVCLSEPSKISKSYFNTAFGILINRCIPEKQYPQICFDYIHQNPTRAGLVSNIDKWEFSSAIDYLGLRRGTLVDISKANELELEF